MTDSGAGWHALNIEELGEGPGLRKVRAAAGITAFGMNVMVLPPGTMNRFHFHDEQEEVYFVHAGELTVEFEDGETTLGAGGLVRVDAATMRRIGNRGSENVVIVALGGKEGYVGRDGQLRADELQAVMNGGAMGGIAISD